MNIQETIENFKAKKKLFTDEVSQQFEKEIHKLASEITGLKEIQWNQYTPYFNDGEACEFRVNEAYFKFEDSEEFQDIWSFNYDRKNKGLAEFEQTKQLEAISELIQNDDLESVLKDMYGDHIEVTMDLTTKETTTSDYSHD